MAIQSATEIQTEIDRINTLIQAIDTQMSVIVADANGAVDSVEGAQEFSPSERVKSLTALRKQYREDIEKYEERLRLIPAQYVDEIDGN